MIPGAMVRGLRLVERGPALRQWLKTLSGDSQPFCARAAFSYVGHIETTRQVSVSGSHPEWCRSLSCLTNVTMCTAETGPSKSESLPPEPRLWWCRVSATACRAFGGQCRSCAHDIDRILNTEIPSSPMLMLQVSRVLEAEGEGSLEELKALAEPHRLSQMGAPEVAIWLEK